MLLSNDELAAKMVKLPKWAQQEMALMRMRLAEARDRIVELEGKNPPGPVAVVTAVSDDPEYRSLDTSLRVARPEDKLWTLGLHAQLDRTMWHERGAVQMRVYGMSQIQVLPVASNVVVIRDGR